MQVDAAIELIQRNCIFHQNDNQMLKRIAKTETNYGTTGTLSQGGIWQVMQFYCLLLENWQACLILANNVWLFQLFEFPKKKNIFVLDIFLWDIISTDTHFVSDLWIFHNLTLQVQESKFNDIKSAQAVSEMAQELSNIKTKFGMYYSCCGLLLM